MAKAKKKKSGSNGKAKNTVALEKTAEDAQVTQDSEEKAKSEKAQKNTEKKASDKKSSDKKKAAEKKPSVFARIAKYFRECRSEVKKIVWPTPKATFKNVGIVLSVLLIVGLFVWLLDTGFIALFKLVMDI